MTNINLYNEILIDLLIIFLEILDLFFWTLRTVITPRGNKKLVSLLGMINNLPGIITLAIVVSDFRNYPDRAIAYALGETIGTYIAMLVDKKIKYGKESETIIIKNDDKDKVVNVLENDGFDVAVITGDGLDGKKAILKVFMNSKKRHELMKIINDESIKAVIFENEILTMKKV